MDRVNEEEIIVVERQRCRGSRRERVYINPPNQLNVVMVEGNIPSIYQRLINGICLLFLPRGYPESVAEDYLPYQRYNMAQTFFSSVAGVLATQEFLRSMGVGDSSVYPLVATISWVYRDWFGETGKILFSYYQGFSIDAYSKRWRLYADLINDVAMTLEMYLSYFGEWTTFVLCISTTLKAFDGVSRATRVALTRHHALGGNLADVAAKEASQETLVKFLASLVAVFILKYIGCQGLVFLFMMGLHLYYNYLAVRVACINTLNEPRYMLAVQSYLSREFIPSTARVNLQENILSDLSDHTMEALTSFKIKIGCSLEEVMKAYPRACDWRKVHRVYRDRLYVLFPDMTNRVMYVILKPGGYSQSIMCAYFHAILLSILICAINDERLPISFTGSNNFISLYQTVMASRWPRTPLLYPTASGLQYEPSERLLRYATKVVEMEWYKVYSGLVRSGWAIQRHMFLIGDWQSSYDPEYATDATDSNGDESSTATPPFVHQTFQEVLKEAIDYRHAEMKLDNGNVHNIRENPRNIQPVVVPEPYETRQVRNRRLITWVEDDEIIHLGSCYVTPDRISRRRRKRPKKD